MKNIFEESALFFDPQVTMEVMERLKAMVPQEDRSAVLSTLGSLTNRDLYFYSIGRATGLSMALTAFQSARLSPLKREEEGGNDAKRK